MNPSRSLRSVLVLIAIIGAIVSVVAINHRNDAPRHTDAALADAAGVWAQSLVVTPVPTAAASDVQSPCADTEPRRLLAEPLAAVRKLIGLADVDNPWLDPQLRSKHNRLNERLDAADRILAGRAGGDNPWLGQRYRSDRAQLYRLAQHTGVDCNALLRLGRWLVTTPSAMTRFQWRERHPSLAGDALVAIDRTLFSRPNPWRHPNGCLYFATPPGQRQKVLGNAALCDPAAESVAPPRGIAPLLAKIRQMSVADPEDSGSNSLSVLGRDVPQGPHVRLTLLADQQATAQNTLDCATGRSEPCRELGIDAARWQDRYENAAVRSVGLLQLDIPSGRIEVIGSAHTRCYQQENDGPGRAPDCPPMPIAAAYRPHLLDNHGLYGQAMPASMVKVDESVGLLRSDLGPSLRGPGRQRFLDDLKASRSIAFIDRLFAKDQGYRDRQRLQHVLRAAGDLGWNANCEHGNRRCGRQSLLFGSDTTPRDSRDESVFTARLQLEPAPGGGQWQPLATAYTPEWAKACAARKWKSCPGGKMAEILAETWGQGHARASPLGVAGMLARLAGAAAGTHIAAPHLVERVDRRPIPAPASIAPALAAADAQLILDGLALTHRAASPRYRSPGSVHLACVAALGSAAACNRLDTVAGKSGTPRFAHKHLKLEERRQLCQRLATGPRAPAHKQAFADCFMPPLKWYAALLREAPGKPYSKAVVVLVNERNWRRHGLVDDPDDKGINVAAEIAFHYLRNAFPEAMRKAAP